MFANREKKRLGGGASDSDPSVSAPRKGRMTGHGRAAARPYQALADDQGRGPYMFLRNEPNLFGDYILDSKQFFC
jgi:hypothetical protein